MGVLLSRRSVIRRSIGDSHWTIQRMRVNPLCITPLYSLMSSGFRIVEFATQEEAQRAIKELSERQFLGRPVYLREVDFAIFLLFHFLTMHRTVKMNRGSVLPLFQERSGWLWRLAIIAAVHHPAHLITDPPQAILATSSTSVM